MKDKLDGLMENEIITMDEADDGLPVRVKGVKVATYSTDEAVAIILPYVYEDISISSREIARRTGLDARTVNKYRKCQAFRNKLAELTNDKLLDLRCLALSELERIVKDSNVSPNVKIKAIHEILSHSVSVAEIAIQSGKVAPKVNIDDLLKEIENM